MLSFSTFKIDITVVKSTVLFVVYKGVPNVLFIGTLEPKYKFAFAPPNISHIFSCKAQLALTHFSFYTLYAMN